jgi:hypothetical protein
MKTHPYLFASFPMSSPDRNAMPDASLAKANAVSRYSMLGMGLFVVFAIVVHALVLAATNANDEAGSLLRGDFAVGSRTWLFAGVGAAFLGFTWLSHLPLAQSLCGSSNKQAVGDLVSASDLSPLAGLMISMAIRIAGTFAILGLLWKWEFVSRKESVFDVLFWYVTLTAMEVVGIVCASRSFVQSSSLGSVSRASDS